MPARSPLCWSYTYTSCRLSLMGASGAGKTTLLDLLAGRKQATHIPSTTGTTSSGTGTDTTSGIGTSGIGNTSNSSNCAAGPRTGDSGAGGGDGALSRLLRGGFCGGSGGCDGSSSDRCSRRGSSIRGSSSRGPVWSGLQLVNGSPVTHMGSGGRGVMGYVEQQDAHNPWVRVRVCGCVGGWVGGWVGVVAWARRFGRGLGSLGVMTEYEWASCQR